MTGLTPGLRERFLQFCEVYEFTKAKLTADEASAAVISSATWKAAQEAGSLTPEELKLYKTLVAMLTASTAGSCLPSGRTGKRAKSA